MFRQQASVTGWGAQQEGEESNKAKQRKSQEGRQERRKQKAIRLSLFASPISGYHSLPPILTAPTSPVRGPLSQLRILANTCFIFQSSLNTSLSNALSSPLHRSLSHSAHTSLAWLATVDTQPETTNFDSSLIISPRPPPDYYPDRPFLLATTPISPPLGSLHSSSFSPSSLLFSDSLFQSFQIPPPILHTSTTSLNPSNPYLCSRQSPPPLIDLTRLFPFTFPFPIAAHSPPNPGGSHTTHPLYAITD